jgi:glutathionylspermidine synthase
MNYIYQQKTHINFIKIKSKKELIKLINELFNIPLEILEFVFKNTDFKRDAWS